MSNETTSQAGGKKPVFAANLKPMLLPSKLLIMDIPLSSVSWPMLCSLKHNGIRGMAIKGIWRSRTGNEHMLCKDIKDWLEPALAYANERGVVLDGEFNSASHNTVGQTRKILAGTIPRPADFKFKVMYEIPAPCWNTAKQGTMQSYIPSPYLDLPCCEAIAQQLITNAERFEQIVENSKHRNIEGFVLLAPEAGYKHNRTTVPEGIAFKYKYYTDAEDAEIMGIIPREERASHVTPEVNEHGMAKATYKQGDKVGTDIGGSLAVKLEDGTRTNVPFPIGYTLADRQKAFRSWGSGNSHDLKGQWVSFQRLACERKDKPVAIKGVELRDSKGSIGDTDD